MTFSDTEAAVLRLLLGDIDREIAAVFGPAAPEAGLASATLRASWARLTGVLALGPAPELRACPVCHRDCRRAATLCGRCWTRLPPAPSGVDAALLAARSAGTPSAA
jgi:hypothetical protein